MPTSPIAQVPPGSLDLLAGDVRRRRRVQRAWFALAERHGYQEVIPPTFEYEEVFTRGGGPELAARLLRFLDQDGRLVALRADFTSAIARVVATRLAEAPLPLRLAYAGKVYRQEPEGVGRRREIFQLGAELIGDPSPEADVEALRLVIQQMRALGLGEFQINLGDIRFVRPLLAGLQPEEAEALQTLAHVSSEALERCRVQLAEERLAAAKDRFLRVASHELRSPVTALRATAQLLQLDESAHSDETRRRLLYDRIDRQSERLANLVAQLLDSARLSADALPLDLEDVDLVALAREMADEAGPRVRLCAEGELHGRWDRARIEQVVSNLLSNALQYSAPEATVELVVATDGVHAQLEVRDRGVGIPVDEQAQVFAPFYRSPRSSGRHKGMGLGLHITSEIVHRHGGTIRVVSESGVGSTFVVQLPRGV